MQRVGFSFGAFCCLLRSSSTYEALIRQTREADMKTARDAKVAEDRLKHCEEAVTSAQIDHVFRTIQSKLTDVLRGSFEPDDPIQRGNVAQLGSEWVLQRGEKGQLQELTVLKVSIRAAAFSSKPLLHIHESTVLRGAREQLKEYLRDVTALPSETNPREKKPVFTVSDADDALVEITITASHLFPEERQRLWVDKPHQGTLFGKDVFAAEKGTVFDETFRSKVMKDLEDQSELVSASSLLLDEFRSIAPDAGPKRKAASALENEINKKQARSSI
jgi:hypothetical protein